MPPYGDSDFVLSRAHTATVTATAISNVNSNGIAHVICNAIVRMICSANAYVNANVICNAK